MVSLLSSLDDSEWATPVPCTPLWTVRDVLSHVAGITDDITNGRTEGAASDPWTAAQVERWRDTEPTELMDRWSGQIDPIADLLERVGEFRLHAGSFCPAHRSCENARKPAVDEHAAQRHQERL